jgi:hypothetical protein
VLVSQDVDTDEYRRAHVQAPGRVFNPSSLGVIVDQGQSLYGLSESSVMAGSQTSLHERDVLRADNAVILVRNDIETDRSDAFGTEQAN